MLKLYLDEDVDVLAVPLFKSLGFDCISALHVGNIHILDNKHLEYATGEGRVLITHNREDFKALAQEWWRLSKAHAGMVLAYRKKTTYELVRLVSPALMLYDQQNWVNVVSCV